MDDLPPYTLLVLDDLRPTPQQLAQIPVARHGAGWLVMGDDKGSNPAAVSNIVVSTWHAFATQSLCAAIIVTMSRQHPSCKAIQQDGAAIWQLQH